MKLNKTLIASLILIVLAVYIITHYWSWGEELYTTIMSASAPFISGAMIAYVVNILMSGYERIYRGLLKTKIANSLARPICLLLAYLTFVVLIVFLVGTVLPELVTSVQSLVFSVPSAVQNLIVQLQDNETINEILTSYFGSDFSSQITSQLTSYLQQSLSSIGTVMVNLVTSVTSIFSTLLNIFISLIFSLYVLASKEQLGMQYHRLVKAYLNKFYKKIENIRLVFHKSFRSFIIGQTLEAVILGTLTYIGMLIFDFPYSSTVSILIGFTALMPVVGAYIGVTIGTILIMTQSFNQAIWFIVFVVILQQFEGNLIYPRVVGKSVGLPGMWVLLAITVGAALGGILGMLMAVPCMAGFYKLLQQDVNRREKLVQDSNES